MSGWCLSNLLPLTPRHRLFAMIAATIPDVDGFGKPISEELYLRYHHVLGHNLLFALLISTVLTIFSTRRILAFVLYFALFHLHLFMDYWGSGPDWPIEYLWPFRSGPDYQFMNANGWAFYSWQNILTAFLLLLWTIYIGWFGRRTPLELLMPKLDRRLVGLPPLEGRGFDPIMPK